MEYKATQAEFKTDAAREGRYEGYFSVFNTVDSGGDVVLPGAFTKTLQENRQRVKVLYGHDTNKLIGGSPDVLEEDSRGLHVAGQLVVASFWGREAWELMRAGALTEGSFGYDPVRADRGANGTRMLKEVKLWEISPVVWGMNAATSVSATKALKDLYSAGGLDQMDQYEASCLLSLLLDYVQDGRLLAGADLDTLRNAYGLLTEAGQTLATLIAAATPDQGNGGQMGMADVFAALSLTHKEGRKLSGASLEKIKAALAALQALIEDAAPPETPTKGVHHRAPLDYRARLIDLDLQVAGRGR